MMPKLFDPEIWNKEQRQDKVAHLSQNKAHLSKVVREGGKSGNQDPINEQGALSRLFLFLQYHQAYIIYGTQLVNFPLWKPGKWRPISQIAHSLYAQNLLSTNLTNQTQAFNIKSEFIWKPCPRPIWPVRRLFEALLHTLGLRSPLPQSAWREFQKKINDVFFLILWFAVSSKELLVLVVVTLRNSDRLETDRSSQPRNCKGMILIVR